MRLGLTVGGLLLFGASACSGSERAATTTTTTSTSSMSTSVPSTTTGAEGGSVCGPYVEYLATGWQFGQTLTAIESAVASSAPPTVVSSVGDIVSAAESGERSDASDDEALKSWALEECSAVYKQGTAPLSSDEDAAQAFFDAVVGGDEARAHEVATANAVAVLAPWAPVERGPGLPRLVDAGQLFRLDLAPEVSYRCRAEGGLVVDCELQE